jgi:hypothetical protein
MLTLAEANQAIAAAVARATAMKMKIAVSICDEEGRLVAFQRMDGVFSESIWIRASVQTRLADGLLPADSLADLPTANAGSHRVNAPDDLVAGNTWISNARETSLDCRDVRVANTARLDANAHLVVAGILKRPSHFSELSWFPYLNGFVGLTHFRSSLFDIREPRRSCRGAFKELAVRLDAFVTAAPPFDSPCQISANRCELGCQCFDSVAMTCSFFSSECGASGKHRRRSFI